MKIVTGTYLKGEELTTEGENFRITGVTEEVLANRDGSPGDTRFILALSGAKPLVLNKTNIRRLVAAFDSNESDEWIGKTIQLYLDPDVEFGGEVVGGIRLRAVPKAAKKAGKPTDEDAIPF
jgi:hypothetical protein|tara:strand:+ start:630 stop:995 length:366 start_codon:yes stop_codon:yes gene_type:complete